MATFYVAAGINHFVHPAMYEKIMPPWLPAHNALVLASGMAEILLGLLLLVRCTRRLAAAGIVLLLVAVFPANVHMLLNYRAEGHRLWWLALLRLPLQGFLIWWAYQYAKPMKREKRAGNSSL
jgi:uncharacterized membrane protein